MSSHDAGPLHSPGFWLHHAALAWRAELDAVLRPLGLTHTQFMLLASTGWLGRHGTPPTQQSVAEHAGADRMMASKVVRGLEQRGLLTRFSHESDARALQLQLTPAGRTLTRQAIEVAQAVDQRIFETQAAHLQPALRVIAEQYGKNTFAKE